MSKTVSPRIADSAAEFYPSIFRNLNAGVEHVLDSFPVLYRMTICSLRGRFSCGELSLMIDVFNGTALLPRLLGQHLGLQCADGIALDGLDEKWEIEKTPFLERIQALTLFESACLELWAVGFWATLHEGVDDGTKLNAWLKNLLVEGGEKKSETTK